jgi:hypothetical protein
MTADWLLWDEVRAEAEYRAEEMRKAARAGRTAPAHPSRRNKNNTLITRSRRTRRGSEAAAPVEVPRQRRGEQVEAGHEHADPAL